MAISAHKTWRVIPLAATDSKSAATIKYIAVPADSIPIAVRWFFLLFVSTLPFEEVDLPFVTGATLPKLCGFLFFACYFLYYGPLLSKRSFPSPPRAMWWFLGYFAIFGLNGLFLDKIFVDEFFVRCFQLVQLIILFWVASDLFKDQKLALTVLHTYSIVAGFVAVGNLLQLPGFYEVSVDGRVTALGLASTGTIMVLAGVITLGLCLGVSYKHFLSKILLLVLPLCFLVVLVKTGSRSYVAAFVLGASVYVFPHWRSKRIWSAIFLVLLAVVGVLYTTADDPLILERWRRTYYEGDVSGRDELYPIAGEIILEKPILGWSVAGTYEIGRREGGRFFSRSRDAHNNFLALLLDVGILGTIPFCVGLGLCGLSAWKARLGNLGLLPLATLVALLACGMSSTLVTYKTSWLILALTLAATATARPAPVAVRRWRTQRETAGRGMKLPA